MSTEPKDHESLQTLLQVVVKALDDEDFRAELKRDPASTIRKAGLTLDEDVEVEVHENTSKKLHVVLPARLDDLDGDAARHRRLINMWPV